MMKAVIVLFILAVSSTMAHSAQRALTVSAGEHDGFSRVVLGDGAQSVIVEESDSSIHLINLDPSIQFDLSEINQSQKAYRVTSAHYVRDSNQTSIALNLNCNCSIRSSHTPTGRFILDIVGQIDAASDNAPRAQLDKPSQFPPEKSALSPDTDRLSVEQAHTRMITLLKQAADDGLITIKANTGQSAVVSRPYEDKSNTALKQVAQQENTQASAANKDHSEAVHPTTSASLMVDAVNDDPSDRTICFADSAFELKTSLTDNPLVGIAELQSELAQVNQNEQLNVARKLAVEYISIGFGEEAVALLKDFGEQDSLLSDIANVLAERVPNASGRLMGARNCTGAHALWQAVVSEHTLSASLFKRSGETVSTLPTHLRKIIATRLANKMIKASSWADVEYLFEIATSDEMPLNPELEYIKARLKAHRGDESGSRGSLLDIATQRSIASEDALIALSDTYARDENNPHDGFMQDIGDLAKTNGSSKAALAEAIAWAGLGNIDTAIMILDNERKKSADDLLRAQATAKTLLFKALSNDDPIIKLTALDAFFKNEDWLIIDPDESKIRNQIAETALHVGLPNLAYDFLERNSKNRTQDELLRKAAASLSADKPNDTIRIAAPYSENPEFGELVVKANIQNANYHAALAAATTLSDDKRKAEIMAHAGWLSRSWNSAVQGFSNINPNDLGKDDAIQYSLSAYMNNDRTLPFAADAALTEESTVLVNGLRSMFNGQSVGTPFQRSQQVVNETHQELLMFEEVLSDG